MRFLHAALAVHLSLQFTKNGEIALFSAVLFELIKFFGGVKTAQLERWGRGVISVLRLILSAFSFLFSSFQSLGTRLAFYVFHYGKN